MNSESDEEHSQVQDEQPNQVHSLPVYTIMFTEPHCIEATDCGLAPSQWDCQRPRYCIRSQQLQRILNNTESTVAKHLNKDVSEAFVASLAEVVMTQMRKCVRADTGVCVCVWICKLNVY